MSSYVSLYGQPEPQPEPLPTELAAEPIVAWRAWRVFTQDEATLNRETLVQLADSFDRGENPWRRMLLPRLGPIAAEGRWDDTTVRAVCRAHEMSGASSWHYYALGGSSFAPVSHDAPAQRCDCGWWAVRSEEQVPDVLAKYRREGRTIAYGRVQLWGRVIEHADGYRAEYARPYDVVVIDGPQDVVTGLRDRYAIDVTAGPVPETVLEIEKKRAEELAAQPSPSSTFSQLALLHQQQHAKALTFSGYSKGMSLLLDDVMGSAPPKRRWWRRG